VPRPDDPQSFNRYAYARNSPLVRVDPSGHLDIPWDKIREAIEQAAEAAGDCLQRALSCLGAPPLALPSTYAMAALTTNVAKATNDAQAGALMAKGKAKDDEKDKSSSGNPGGSAGGPGGGGDDLAKDGRKGKQQRLIELGVDPKQPSEIRGWIKNEQRHIAQGNRTSIRNPPGYDLAHRRGFEARKGYGYDHADLQLGDLHKLQHRYEGTKGVRPSWVRQLLDRILGKK
jgi:hypothetical protein